MKNLIFLIGKLIPGGAESQLVTLAKGLDKNRFNTTVLCLYGGGALENDLRTSGVSVIPLHKKKGGWGTLTFFVRLYRTLRKLSPDVLHGYMPVCNIVSVCFKPLFPSTQIFMGIRSSDVGKSKYGYYQRIMYGSSFYLSKFADHIIVNSKAGFQNAANRGTPESKMAVVPNGIDTNKFRPNKTERNRLRREFGLSDEEFLIGRIGRFHPMKDYEGFLHAAALFVKKFPQTKFMVVGGGPDEYQKKLKSLILKLGLSSAVIWVGFRSDMDSFYNVFDMVTSSSSFGEGFPNVIGEAMACNVPCVVTDIGDSAWVVGDAGVVVMPSDSKELAKGWEQCHINWKEYSLKSRARIVNEFSINNLVNNTQKLLLS
jgi:glycosyltransferase involved in cell wall biosynthesis